MVMMAGGDAVIVGKHWRRWLTTGLLAAILGVAFWLRWLYVRDVSPYVDEYITLRAARQILDRGLPLLPTGNFYSHGLLLSYVEAGVMALTGFNALAARLPVLLVSLLAVALTWWVGRQWFSSPVGLLAAALLALAPDAIIWGGRARMYTPLQLFVLLALFFYWHGLARGGNRRDSALGRSSAFALCFLGALFDQAEAMVLLPVLGVIALAAAWPDLRRNGPGAVLRRWWQTGLVAAWIVAALGVLTELWFRQMGPPMVSYLGAGAYGPSGRVYVQPAWDWPGIRKTLEPLLTSPAVLGIAGLFAAGLALSVIRSKGRRRAIVPASWQRPLVYLLAVVALTLAGLLFVADPSWKSPRYLFMLLPIIFLALAAGLLGLAGESPAGRRWQWVLLGGALVAGVAGSWPAAWAAAHENVAAYDDAFAYVAGQWQPGDAVMAFVPQASIFYLGECDYLSVPTDYRGFAYEQDGRWLEGWDGIPLVDSAAGLAEALAAHDRLWFVVDEHRFHTRFAPGFAQAVWAGMDLVWRNGQVMVFRTATPPPPAAFQERRVDLGPISLVGYALEAAPQSGADLPLTLYWMANEEPPAVYSAFVHVVDAGGTGWAQDDGPPLGEVYPTNRWWPDELLRGRRIVSLPADLPAGLYRLDVGLYDPATMEHLVTPDGSQAFPLGFVRLGPPEAVPPELTSLNVVFGDQIRLLGYELTPAGPRAWTLTLAWAAEAPVAHDYTVFVHLVDESGEIRGQDDAPPGGGFYPTSFWTPGETAVDHHPLSLPADSPAGIYRLRVGLYRPETGERLPTAAGDFVELETWTIP
jgi:4-amino-4-deoxy-L-arabinose transferase-like glycosyltransferase